MSYSLCLKSDENSKRLNLTFNAKEISLLVLNIFVKSDKIEFLILRNLIYNEEYARCETVNNFSIFVLSKKSS